MVEQEHMANRKLGARVTRVEKPGARKRTDDPFLQERGIRGTSSMSHSAPTDFFHYTVLLLFSPPQGTRQANETNYVSFCVVVRPFPLVKPLFFRTKFDSFILIEVLFVSLISYFYFSDDERASDRLLFLFLRHSSSFPSSYSSVRVGAPQLEGTSVAAAVCKNVISSSELRSHLDDNGIPFRTFSSVFLFGIGCIFFL